MILQLRSPRLLPFTITALSALLAIKAVDLARYVVAAHRDATTVVAAAQAAAPEPSPAAAVAGGAKAAGPAAPGAGAPQAKPAAGSAAASAAAPALPSRDATQGETITDSERSVLVDLRQRRQQLDGRDAALTAREAILTAAEQKLEAQAQALTALQKKLQDLEAARTQREEAGWQGLVKLYENMKPRDAATIFNDLDMPVLLSLVDRMKELKAAPILAAMSPDKARDVTARLANLRTRREAAGGTAASGG